MTRTALLALLLVLTTCGGGSGGSGDSGSGVDGDDGSFESTWRSALYPGDWTPAHTDAAGRFLHDVSYAGFRGGQEALPDGTGLAVVDAIVDHGADASGASDATSALQAAISDAASRGGAIVFLPAGLYRVDDRLSIAASNIVLRGEGAALTKIHFTRHASMTGLAHLTIGTTPTLGSHLLLSEDATPRSRDVFVTDAQSLQVGQDVALGFTITPAFIDEHGMTGTWGPFNDSWQPFERREIVAIDMSSTPHRVTLDVPVRYPALVRDGASLRAESGYLSGIGVEHLGVANAVGWDDAWNNERTHAVSMTGIKDGWVRGVASFVSPSAPTTNPGAGAHLQNCGILLLRCKRLTIADCRMEHAQHRGGGGCGYLFEIRQCNEVLTRDCIATAGRHNFIQNWGFGTSGCVWLRCHSEQGFALFSKDFPTIGQLGYSEFHHSLATANLIDSCTTMDGWSGVNRGSFSSGAGHSATQNIFWNAQGDGVLRSKQFDWGYIVGTATQVQLNTNPGSDSTPEDWTENSLPVSELRPQSLYLDQHLRRTGSDAEATR